MNSLVPSVATARAFSIEAFCATYHVGRTFAFAEIKAGRLKARKAGRKTLILRDDAEQWIASLPERGPTDA